MRCGSFASGFADAENLPPFVIFHDSTLREMCKVMPTTERAMRGVKGIGEAKYRQVRTSVPGIDPEA